MKILKPEYEPKTLTQKLGHLMEECGEVVSAGGKSMRFGFESANIELPVEMQVANVDWLLREISDVEGAIARIKPDLTSLSAVFRAAKSETPR